MNDSGQFDEAAACERCGRFGAHRFDGALLCGDCYAGAGSCCAEFGADDLTTRSAGELPAAKRVGPTAPRE